MATKIQFRRGTAAQWTAANPVMADGEIGLESDTDKMKLGNGVQAWASRPYANTGPQGPTGATGAQGPQGNTGTAGSQGPQGAPGDPLSVLAAYPVGAVYTSVVSTNPGTLFGGTWQTIGGFLLAGYASGDADWGTPGATGGARTSTPTGTVLAPIFMGTASQATSAVSAGTPAGTVAAPAFTGSSNQNTSAVTAGTPAGTVAAPVFTGTALGTHAHELPFIKAAGGTAQLKMLAQSIFGSGTSRAPESISAAPTANTTAAAVALSQAVSAGTPAGTNSAPAFTGSALGAHQHTLTPAGTNSAPAFTGNALGTHSHTLTPSGTNSAPIFMGDSMPILPPTLTVYMWKRTA